ncbi:putative DNA-binding transcriptional regulator [Serratia fonticola]|uniref:DNA-binding protein n=1 Tax=Serratia fonticola TaxID=47917 RepID=UPI0015C65056|nr:DNA-binding protein [Serratia fonticola]NXZ85792.1 putative DNA-binding transcriptional regulator [Serratia fonticola]
MDKEWFTANELKEKGELGSSPQGINKRAREQNWRWQRRFGKQGVTKEYHISSLPLSTQNELYPQRYLLAAEESAAYTVSCDGDPWVRLQSYLAGMKPDEYAALLSFLAENGAARLLDLISKANK